MRETRNSFKISVGKFEGRNHLGSLSVDDMNPEEIRSVHLNCIRMGQDKVQCWALLKIVMKLRVP
jgi:hypothetical protein